MKPITTREFRANLSNYMRLLREGKPVQVKNLILMGKPASDLTKEQYCAIIDSD